MKFTVMIPVTCELEAGSDKDAALRMFQTIRSDQCRISISSSLGYRLEFRGDKLRRTNFDDALRSGK